MLRSLVGSEMCIRDRCDRPRPAIYAGSFDKTRGRCAALHRRGTFMGRIPCACLLSIATVAPRLHLDCLLVWCLRGHQPDHAVQRFLRLTRFSNNGPAKCSPPRRSLLCCCCCWWWWWWWCWYCLYLFFCICRCCCCSQMNLSRYSNLRSQGKLQHMSSGNIRQNSK